MLKLTHYDDKKEKWQSHEIRFSDESDWKIFENGSISGHELNSIVGYGKTKEEAIKNFQEVLNWYFREIEAIKDLWDSGFYERSIVEVDYKGDPING